MVIQSKEILLFCFQALSNKQLLFSRALAFLLLIGIYYYFSKVRPAWRAKWKGTDQYATKSILISMVDVFSGVIGVLCILWIMLELEWFLK